MKKKKITQVFERAVFWLNLNYFKSKILIKSMIWGIIYEYANCNIKL